MTFDNLALACVSCSLRKEARRTALDPMTGALCLCFILAGSGGPDISDGMVIGLPASRLRAERPCRRSR